MKTFRFIGMALVAMLVCVNFTSCKDSEDGPSSSSLRSLTRPRGQLRRATDLTPSMADASFLSSSTSLCTRASESEASSAARTSSLFAAKTVSLSASRASASLQSMALRSLSDITASLAAWPLNSLYSVLAASLM